MSVVSFFVIGSFLAYTSETHAIHIKCPNHSNKNNSDSETEVWYSRAKDTNVRSIRKASAFAASVHLQPSDETTNLRIEQDSDSIDPASSIPHH